MKSIKDDRLVAHFFTTTTANNNTVIMKSIQVPFTLPNKPRPFSHQNVAELNLVKNMKWKIANTTEFFQFYHC